MTEPAVIARFCNIVGLDAAKLKFSWVPASEEELAQLANDQVRRFLSPLLASDGVMKGKTSANLNIDVEAKKWREELGEENGERRDGSKVLPDYKIMKARRLRPKSTR